MPSGEIDTVDKGILYLLQENARGRTTTDIADKIGVSSSTVANRISELEEADVITGYQPSIDYENAGLDHHFLVGATVPLADQGAAVDEILDVVGVVNVQELMTNTENVLVEFVARDRDEVETGLVELNAICDDVRWTEVVKQSRAQPYDHFGKQYTSEDGAG